MAKLAKYDRIKARTDGRRPDTLAETLQKYPMFATCFVMNLKLLTPASSEATLSWSEKDANAMQAREAEKL